MRTIAFEMFGYIVFDDEIPGILGFLAWVGFLAFILMR